MFTIVPPCSWACMTRLAAWATWTAEVRLRVSTFSVKRGEAVAAGAPGEPPALLTTTSICPRSATIDSTRASTEDGSVTSAARKPTPSGSAPGSGSDRPHTTTLAPASRSRSAMALPMPRVPPVTRATRSRRSIWMGMWSPRVVDETAFGVNHNLLVGPWSLHRSLGC